MPWADGSGLERGSLAVDLGDPPKAEMVVQPPARASRRIVVTAATVRAGALVHMGGTARAQAQQWLGDNGMTILARVPTARLARHFAQAIESTREAADGQAWLAGGPYINIRVGLIAGTSDEPFDGSTASHTAAGTELLTDLTVNAQRLNALSDADMVQQLTAALCEHLDILGRRRRLGPVPWHPVTP